eukprot:3484187-Prymnesium_polylepis.1
MSAGRQYVRRTEISPPGGNISPPGGTMMKLGIGIIKPIMKPSSNSRPGGNFTAGRQYVRRAAICPPGGN